MYYADYIRRKMCHLQIQQIISAVGYPVTLIKSLGKSLKQYKIYGNSIQNGTPTPDSPVEVQSVGDLVTDTQSEYYGKYKIPVTCSCKNLFNKDLNYILGSMRDMANGTGTKIRDGFELQGNSGVLTNAHSYNNGWFRPGDYLNSARFYLKAGEKVTVSADVEVVQFSAVTGNNKMRVYLNGAQSITPSNDKTISTTKQRITWNSFTISVTGTYYPEFTICGNKVRITNIQVEKNTTSTSYEPYHAPVTTNIYLNSPLRKIGDYADYIDFKRQKVVRNITHVAYVGGWSLTSGHEFNRPITETVNNTNAIHALSNYYKGAPRSYLSNLQVCANSTYLRLVNSSFSAASELNNWLAEKNNEGNPMYIDYVIKTPIEEAITLPPVLTVKGDCIITTETTVQPSNMEVIYLS